MNEELLEKVKLLNKLDKSSKPLWGSMTAQHMVEHLIYSFQMSNGKLKIECPYEERQIRVSKRFLMGEKPFPKGFVNPAIGEKLIDFKFENLQIAIKSLENEVEDFYNYFEENPNSLTTNVTFGDLKKEEWDVFHNKHITHHFSQFALI